MSATSNTAPSTGASGNKTCFVERFKTFQFFRDDKKELRALVLLINNEPFVGLSKFWYRAESKTWCPSKKGHLYMSPTQWKALAMRSHAITQAANVLEKRALEEAAGSGIRPLISYKVYSR
jgi:hypothetical protein